MPTNHYHWLFLLSLSGELISNQQSSVVYHSSFSLWMYHCMLLLRLCRLRLFCCVGLPPFEFWGARLRVFPCKRRPPRRPPAGVYCRLLFKFWSCICCCCCIYLCCNCIGYCCLFWMAFTPLRWAIGCLGYCYSVYLFFCTIRRLLLLPFWRACDRKDVCCGKAYSTFITLSSIWAPLNCLIAYAAEVALA